MNSAATTSSGQMIIYFGRGEGVVVSNPDEVFEDFKPHDPINKNRMSGKPELRLV